MKRYNNFDILRILSCIAVIMIHVSSTYRGDCDFDEKDMLGIIIYNTLSRFAVPCFVMLAGAFALSNEKNSDYGYYYRKTLSNIGISTIIFSLLYFAYSMMIAMAKIVVGKSDYTVLFTPIIDAIKGAPFHHMWYLYMMIIPYLLVPIIIKVKNDINKKTFHKIAVIIMVISILSGWTANIKLNYGIKSFAFLGYFLLGYVIKECFRSKKSNIGGALIIAIGFIIEIILSLIQYKNSIFSAMDNIYMYIEPLNPMISVASVFIFIGFSMLTIKVNCTRLASKTFLIYLFHAGVWDIISKVIKDINTDYILFAIPLFVLLVFIISYVLSALYEKIWKLLDNKFLITEKICNKIFKNGNIPTNEKRI